MAEFYRNVLGKACGLELIELENTKYHLRVYNPRLIHDLNEAFEVLKRELIDDKADYRKNFITKCEEIHIEQLI